MANGENTRKYSVTAGFSVFPDLITQALIVIKSVQIDDFWTLDMSISTLDMSVSTLDMLLSTLDMLLSTLDSRQLPRLHETPTTSGCHTLLGS